MDKESINHYMCMLYLFLNNECVNKLVNVCNRFIVYTMAMSVHNCRTSVKL